MPINFENVTASPETKEVKMTNLEKWKQKLTEAKDGKRFLYILSQMDDRFYAKHCFEYYDYCGDKNNCEMCKYKEQWLNEKAETEN